jgi:hypothetical protein
VAESEHLIAQAVAFLEQVHAGFLLQPRICMERTGCITAHCSAAAPE